MQTPSGNYEWLLAGNCEDGITRTQNNQVELYREFATSELYPDVFELETFETTYQNYQKITAQLTQSKTPKSFKSKKSKKTHRKTEETGSYEVETVGLDSAKSLEIKKILKVISESLSQLVIRDAFLQWCETRVSSKTTESILERSKLFFESSYSKGLSLDSLTSEVAGRTPSQIADATMTIVKDDPSLHNKWHEWSDNNEVPKATRELWAMEEALEPLTLPLVEIRRKQEEVEMQNTTEKQRQLDKQSSIKEQRQLKSSKIKVEDDHQSKVRKVHQILDHFGLRKTLTEDQNMERTVYTHFADSNFFPKTDQGAKFKDSPSNLNSMLSTASSETVNAMLGALRDTLSTDSVLGEAHDMYWKDSNNDYTIGVWRDFSMSQSFKKLPKDIAAGFNSRFEKIKPNMSYRESQSIVVDIENVFKADIILRNTFSAWRSSPQSSGYNAHPPMMKVEPDGYVVQLRRREPKI